MANVVPAPIFLLPCKVAIRTALVSAGLSDLEVRFDQVERSGVWSASIINSKQIPPVMNRKDERSNSGQVCHWLGDNGNKWTRERRFSFDLHLDVSISGPKLDECVLRFFEFCRHLPRSIKDGQLQSGLLVQDPNPGNPIELTILAPQLPDDTVSTAKSYVTKCIVRAEGGIYLDTQKTFSVTPKPRLAAEFLA